MHKKQENYCTCIWAFPTISTKNENFNFITKSFLLKTLSLNFLQKQQHETQLLIKKRLVVSVICLSSSKGAFICSRKCEFCTGSIISETSGELSSLFSELVSKFKSNFHTISARICQVSLPRSWKTIYLFLQVFLKILKKMSDLARSCKKRLKLRKTWKKVPDLGMNSEDNV